jgi:hypothetical protein
MRRVFLSPTWVGLTTAVRRITITVKNEKNLLFEMDTHYQMNHRQYDRINKKLYARLSSESLNCMGLIHNVSEGGLFIYSNKEFHQGTMIDIEIFMPDSEISFLKGIVKRNIEKPASERRYGLGIELINKDAIYICFIQKLCANHNEIPEQGVADKNR